jgi:carbon-monoxide dehydrogenase medium subunit
MFPKSCSYVQADSLEDASELLREHGDDAVLLAGGQSLIPMMKLRLASPKVVVDLSHIESEEITLEDDHVRIPALVTHAEAMNHPTVAEHFEIITDAVPQIADPQIRNMGTVGGSLAQADPSGDWGPLALATGGVISTVSTSGSRDVPAGEFFEGPLSTCLENDEIIESVSLPVPGPNTGGSYLKIKRRQGVYAVVSVGVQVTLTDDDKIDSAGVVFNSIGPRYFNPSDVEDLLVGEAISDDIVAEASALLEDEIEAISDIRGSAEFKKNACESLFERGLHIAAQRARGNEVENDPMMNVANLEA